MILNVVLIRNHWNKNIITLNWTLNAAASYLLINEDDRKS